MAGVVAPFNPSVVSESVSLQMSDKLQFVAAFDELKLIGQQY
jgi:hypothetical protein